MAFDSSSAAEPPHERYLRQCLERARQSPPQPTNFRVGALLLDPATGDVLSDGYTLELPGNTHAEQVCLLKLAAARGVPEERVGEVLPPGTVLYTTMEPCNLRLSGNAPCVERILWARVDGKSRIEKVVVGVAEPGKFVGVNEGRKRLEDAGIEFVHVPGLEKEILEVATAGHTKTE